MPGNTQTLERKRPADTRRAESCHIFIHGKALCDGHLIGDLPPHVVQISQMAISPCVGRGRPRCSLCALSII